MADSRVTNRSEELRRAIDHVGYYPKVVADAVGSALAGEAVNGFVIHHEPTFDRDEVRRHVTVLVLTSTRLVVAHTDEHPPDDLLPEPYASTSTEAIPISRVGSVAVTRMVANPAAPSEPREAPGVSEAVLTIGWGAVKRVDLEPATCADPECVADHGYSGMLAAEDFALRISSSADGPEAVDRLLEFARALSEATVGPPVVATAGPPSAATVER
ncbi:MAG: phosphodiesterase [Nocardioidaceae bacterium]|nr:phosphodiesterase [Nocardioidaceae bacterium]